MSVNVAQTAAWIHLRFCQHGMKWASRHQTPENHHCAVFGHARCLQPGVRAHDTLRSHSEHGIVPDHRCKWKPGRSRHTWLWQVPADCQFSASDAQTAANDCSRVDSVICKAKKTDMRWKYESHTENRLDFRRFFRTGVGVVDGLEKSRLLSPDCSCKPHKQKYRLLRRHVDSHYLTVSQQSASTSRQQHVIDKFSTSKC